MSKYDLFAVDGFEAGASGGRRRRRRKRTRMSSLWRREGSALWWWWVFAVSVSFSFSFSFSLPAALLLHCYPNSFASSFGKKTTERGFLLLSKISCGNGSLSKIKTLVMDLLWAPFALLQLGPRDFLAHKATGKEFFFF